jgi:zinc protease
MTSKLTFGAGAFLLLLCSTQGVAAERSVTTKVLDNGCTLAVVENHQAPVVSLRIYITNTGSIFEGEFLGCGISHFYEQLVHGGTTSTRTAAQAAKLLQSIGASTNAYTRPDLTCYYGETHIAYFDQMLDLFADWVQNCALDPDEIEREKGVIKKELIKTQDEPDRVANQLLMKTMFRTHPVRHPTSGYLDNFLRITPGDLRKFFEERYAPNNTVVVVGGDVDPQKVMEKLESAFLLWERRAEFDHSANLPREPRQMDRRYAETEMDVREAHVRIGFHTIELSHRDLYALDLLAAVLGNGRTSRLHTRLVEKDRLTDSVEVASYTPHYGSGVFRITALCPLEKVPALEEALFAEVARLAKDLPTTAELDRAKALIERSFLLGQLRAADQAEAMAIDLISTGDPNFSARYIERIRAVTADQVRAMARKYFSPENETIVVVKPRGETVLFPSAKRVPGVSAARGDGATTRKVVLTNGFTILLQRNTATPTVGVQAFFRAGVLWETDQNAGISNLLARLMLCGTKASSGAQIAEQLEDVGALMSAVSGNNTFGMSMELPARNVRQGLWLFAEVLRDASFPADQVEREKHVSRMLIRRQTGSWETEAQRNFRSAMFLSHPYRRDRFGTLGSMDRIDRDAVADFHMNYCTPKNGVLAVFGDIDLAATERLVRAAFGDWAPGPVVARDVPVEPVLTESRVVTFPSSKGQVVICLGYPGATLDSKDRWVLQVIDAAISGLGLPSGRLHEALRGQRNLVYYVHALNWSGFGAGSFYVICPCLRGEYDEVLGIIRREIAHLVKNGLTPAELENAKKMCITTDQIYRQTNTERASAAALNLLYGFGWDAWTKNAETIGKITNEDVKRVAAAHFAQSVLALTAPARWLKMRGKED